ncbi:hypothetical protein NIES2100_05530 [Calothrix sp. NIES-2100]|uniref:hypothetical protein n=1 Tax=Calothrix sp. NIES-2100 TaxID=1954172 RepID=UPI000B611893|nr:hypothetical protein NIES2100_05530 [Calothrix sp. NIES-2100]
MFNNLSTALETVKRYLQIDDLDSTEDIFLTTLLENSTGTNRETNQKEYRPFYVCAKFRKFKPANNGVIEMSGTDTVKFQDPELVIQGFIEMQQELDKALINIKTNIDTSHRFSVFVV